MAAIDSTMERPTEEVAPATATLTMEEMGTVECELINIVSSVTRLPSTIYRPCIGYARAHMLFGICVALLGRDRCLTVS